MFFTVFVVGMVVNMFNRKFLGAGGGGAPAPATIVYNSNYDSTSQVSGNFTFSSANIGSADPSRVVLVTASCQRGAGGSAMGLTVGGVAATPVATTSISSFFVQALFRINVASGTTATIVLQSNNGTSSEAAIGVFSMYDASSSIPFDTAQATASGPSVNLNVPANGIIIAGSSGISSPSYTGITQRYQNQVSAFRNNSGASNDGLAAQTGRTISQANGTYLVAASFA